MLRVLDLDSRVLCKSSLFSSTLLVNRVFHSELKVTTSYVLKHHLNG